MEKVMSRQVGIWIDTRVAELVLIEQGQLQHQSILSNVEDFNPKGGSRSKSPYGPMDKLDEKKYLQRKKSQLKTYFQAIEQEISSADELYIFGPAQTKDQLAKSLMASEKFHGQILAIETADNMTTKQIIAKVKEFFT